MSITIDDAELRTGVELLDAMSRQVEIEARVVREALVAGVLQDEVAAVETAKLVGTRAANERHVRNLAVGDYEAPVLAVLDHPDRAPYVVAMDAAANDPLKVEIGPMLDSTPDAPGAQLRTAQDSVAQDRGSARRLAAQRRDDEATQLLARRRRCGRAGALRAGPREPLDHQAAQPAGRRGSRHGERASAQRGELDPRDAAR